MAYWQVLENSKKRKIPASFKTDASPSKVHKINEPAHNRDIEVPFKLLDFGRHLIHPILRLKDTNDLFGLIERRPPHPTEIKSFGIVSIFDKDNALSNLAIVSKIHYSVLYIYHNKQKSPLPTIMGCSDSRVITLHDQFRNFNKYNNINHVALLILLILEGCAWPNVSPLSIASFLMSLIPTNKTATYAEYLRLLGLMRQQPAFDVSRDTVMIDCRGQIIPRSSTPDFFMPGLPAEVILDEIYKHLPDKNDFRLLSQKARNYLKLHKKNISFHAIESNPLSKLEDIISHTHTVTLTCGGQFQVNNKAVWKKLRLSSVLLAFSRVDTLILDVTCGKDLEKFLAGVLLQSECQVRSIRFHTEGNYKGAKPNANILAQAIAKNTSVKSYDLCGPHFVLPRSPMLIGIDIPVLQPWIKGLAQCQHIEMFKYDEQFTGDLPFSDRYTASSFTDTQDILNILTSNQDSLRQVHLSIAQNDAMDVLADKFRKEGKVVTLNTPPEEWAQDKKMVISGVDTMSQTTRRVRNLMKLTVNRL